MPNYLEQPRFTCALGAQQTVVAIKRAVPILHSGPGCSQKIHGFIGEGQGYAGSNTIPCTNANESDIVFGGEQKLRDVIDGSLRVIDADLYVVLTGCTSDIVGDDVGEVSREFSSDGKPVVFAETGGFKSNNYVSHDVVVNAIIDQYVDAKRTSTEVRKGLVNVFATIPYQDPFWNGNLTEIKRILTGIGLEVNILFGQDSKGISEWESIPEAQFNILISAWPGLKIVENLREKYGTPFLHFPYLPVGGIETSQFLRQVAEFGGLPKKQVEAFIEQEESKFYAHIERTADFVLEFLYTLPRKFYTVLDATYSIGFSKFLLHELGIVPVKHFVVDGTPEEYREQVLEQFRTVSDTRKIDVAFNEDGGLVQEEIRNIEDHEKKQAFSSGLRHDMNGKPVLGDEWERDWSRPLILGSAWDKLLAQQIGADLVIVGVPVNYRLVLNCAYAGYTGGLRLIEDIYDEVLGALK